MTSSGVPCAPPQEAVDFLKRRGVGKIPHSGRSLLDHLIGTFRLLSSWNRRRELCLAGLFHSIYGTGGHIRPAILFDQRPDVQGVIGTEAETLAYHFSMMDRERFAQDLGRARIVSRFDGSETPIDSAHERDLSEMIIANRLEILAHQGRGSGGMEMAVLIGIYKPFLSAEAFDSWMQGLIPQLGTPGAGP